MENGWLARVRGQASELWGMLGRWQKLALVGGAVVFLGAVLFFSLLSRPQLVPLFDQMDPADAGDIVAVLDEQKVPYKVGRDGRLMVPADERYNIQWSLASAGLPKGGSVGYEIFDQSSFSRTDFERRVNLIRALQGELQRTLERSPGISEARVQIVLQEDSLFIKESKPATAAVYLKLKPGHDLDPDQVKGIVGFVSRAVQGLRPEDVTVVDDRFRVLSQELPGSDASSPSQYAGRNLEIQQSFQTNLQKSVQTLLEQVFGPGNVVTRITAELNFDQTTIDRTLFQPVADGQGIVKTIQKLQEAYQGSGTVPGGTPGTDSNSPGIPNYAGQNGQGPSSYERTETTTAYEVSQIREQVVVAPGTVRRLSVGVVINRDLDPAMQDQVRETIAAVIGADPARSDVITVAGLAFDTSLAQQLQKDLEAERKAAGGLSTTALVGSLSAAVLAIALLSVVMRRRREMPGEAVAGQVAATLSSAPQQSVPALTFDPAKEKIREQIEKLTRTKPEMVAEVLRSWLTED